MNKVATPNKNRVHSSKKIEMFLEDLLIKKENNDIVLELREMFGIPKNGFKLSSNKKESTLYNLYFDDTKYSIQEEKVFGDDKEEIYFLKKEKLKQIVNQTPLNEKILFRILEVYLMYNKIYLEDERIVKSLREQNLCALAFKPMDKESQGRNLYPITIGISINAQISDIKNFIEENKILIKTFQNKNKSTGLEIRQRTRRNHERDNFIMEQSMAGKSPLQISFDVKEKFKVRPPVKTIQKVIERNNKKRQ